MIKFAKYIGLYIYGDETYLYDYTPLMHGEQEMISIYIYTSTLLWGWDDDEVINRITDKKYTNLDQFSAEINL